jgi:hypothetical protein
MTQTSDNRAFVRLASALVHDIDELIEDANFTERGGEITVAVDFSEIYAYCMSSASAFVQRYAGRAPDGDRVHLLEMLHESIMMYQMFEASQELWLLEPYQVEFSNFMKMTASRRFTTTLEEVGRTLRHSRNLSADPRFIELSKLAQITHEKGDTATADERRRLSGLLDELIPDLVDIRNLRAHHPPVQKARDLLAKRRLVVPTDLPVEVARGEPAVEARWLEALSKARPEALTQNVSDSRAMAGLFAANRWLRRKSTWRKMILLTRSETMHAIMRKEAAEWESVGGAPLRHPRGVLALLDERAEIVRGPPLRQIHALQRWQQTFRMVTDSNATASLSHSRLNPDEILKRHTAVIFDAWRRYCGLTAMMNVVQNEWEVRGDNADYLAILLNQDQLKTLIRDRLLSLDSFFVKTEFISGTMRSSELRTAARAPRSKPTTKARPAQASAQSGQSTMVQLDSGHGTPMHFRIGLRTPRLINALQDPDPWHALTTLAAGDGFEIGREPDRDLAAEAEWYIAIGYVLASLGVWSRVQEACALAQSEFEDTFPEAALLELRAIRRESGDYAILAKAIGRPGVVKASTHGHFLRFLGERISYESRLLRLSHDDNDAKRKDKHWRRLLVLLQEGLQEIRSRPASPETCEICNRVTYNLHEFRRLEIHIQNFPPTLGTYASAIDLFYRTFAAQLAEIYGPDQSRWPDTFADTFAWVGLAVLDTNARRDIEGLVTRAMIQDIYKSIPERPFVSEGELQEFRQHATTAKAWLARG